MNLTESIRCLLSCLSTVLVISGSLAQQVRTPGYITTIAGNGEWQHSGDGGSPLAASFMWVTSAVVTKKGDIYIADSQACVIRKITKSTDPIITTIAGIPDECDGTGDGGPAIDAKLDEPSGLYFDESTGPLYIADFSNHRIRMIDSKGKISTVAGNGDDAYSGDGGLATEASLSYPSAVIRNSKGELFILDTDNYRVRKVGTDKKISTVVGTGEEGEHVEGEEATKSPMYLPVSFAVNNEGEMFILTEHYDDDDNEISTVLKVGTDGRVRKFAGNGQSGFSGDGGPAVDASVNYARGIALGKSGEVYIADSGNYRIRMVNSKGIISTIAGTDKGEYAGDDGPAIDASFLYPWNVHVAPNGDLYVCDGLRLRVIYSSEQPNSASGLNVNKALRLVLLTVTLLMTAFSFMA